MSAIAREANGPATFETMHDATRRYRLDDSNIRNVQIADHLGVIMGRGDFNGQPSCIFYWEGYPVAIRTTEDEVAIFHLHQMFQDKMKGIGERIIE